MGLDIATLTVGGSQRRRETSLTRGMSSITRQREGRHILLSSILLRRKMPMHILYHQSLGPLMDHVAIPICTARMTPRECHLDTSRKRCDMTYRDPNPADSCSTEDRKWTSRRRPNMNAKILTFSSHGDTTLLEYDPETADMEEINRVIAEYEAKTGAQPFDMATGERIPKVTREQNEVLMVHPIAGG